MSTTEEFTIVHNGVPIERIVELASSEEGFFLSGQAGDAETRAVFEKHWNPGEIGHFTMFEREDGDDDEYIKELLQPYSGDGVPEIFAIEWPESVYVDRLLFTSEERAMERLFPYEGA